MKGLFCDNNEVWVDVHGEHLGVDTGLRISLLGLHTCNCERVIEDHMILGLISLAQYELSQSAEFLFALKQHNQSSKNYTFSHHFIS